MFECMTFLSVKTLRCFNVWIVWTFEFFQCLNILIVDGLKYSNVWRYRIFKSLNVSMIECVLIYEKIECWNTWMFERIGCPYVGMLERGMFGMIESFNVWTFYFINVWMHDTFECQDVCDI